MRNPRDTWEYRRNAKLTLAASDLCHLCLHPGARTADHIVSVKEWLERHGTDLGVNALSNLAPAHGNRGPDGENRCTECNQLCNQARGAASLEPGRRSQAWG